MKEQIIQTIFWRWARARTTRVWMQNVSSAYLWNTQTQINFYAWILPGTVWSSTRHTQLHTLLVYLVNLYSHCWVQTDLTLSLDVSAQSHHRILLKHTSYYKHTSQIGGLYKYDCWETEDAGATYHIPLWSLQFSVGQCLKVSSTSRNLQCCDLFN